MSDRRVEPDPTVAAPIEGARSARVSVIIPCHDDGRLLLEALDSIIEPEPVDLIVIDDCSTESETLEILERLPEGVRLKRHAANKGLANARNTGLSVVTTPYVFPLDSDDLAYPGALSRMADRLDTEPDVAVCFGDYLEFGGADLVREVPRRLDAFRLLYINEYPVSALFRCSVLRELGGWRHLGEGYKAGYEDWDLWLTLVERRYEGVHLGPGAPSYRRRIHGTRMLSAAKRQHVALYAKLKSDHPLVFAGASNYRRESDMSPIRKFLYPIVYGRRRRFGFEKHFKRLLDRAGIWTLRR